MSRHPNPARDPWTWREVVVLVLLGLLLLGGGMLDASEPGTDTDTGTDPEVGTALVCERDAEGQVVCFTR